MNKHAEYRAAPGRRCNTHRFLNHKRRMSKIRFKRFIHPRVLKGLGRDLLARFFQSVHPPGAAAPWLPPAQLPDEQWFGLLARNLSVPEALPESVAEALWALDEMATPEGQEALETAAACQGLRLSDDGSATREELALKVWLAAPDLLTAAHNRQRLKRLTAFEHFGPTVARADRPPFTPPADTTLAAVATALEPWFARHSRGQNTTRVDLYRIEAFSSSPAESSPDTNYWFVVRHGDTYTRTPKVEAQKTEILHFRPERDDVVMYSPALDELCVNARTRGERELYVQVFGLHLRGRMDYFRRQHTYTLEPLRTDGPAALNPAGVQGLEKITLRELEIAWDDNRFDQKVIYQASDLFELAASSPAQEVIPGEGRLVRAAFDLHFTGCPKPRPVQIRVPNLLKLGRHCDASRVQSWLALRRFRTPRK